MNAEKTIVLGLDGAHFELISPWVESGELPNVGQCIDGGVSGDLQSVLPPVTSPNWKAYSTGKNPGRIGIFWWKNIDTQERRVYYPSHRKHENTEFWELLGESDGAGVINVPTTYPPKPVDPVLIAGAPDGENSGYTHPSHLEEELADELGYRPLKTHSIKRDRTKAVEEILGLIDLRFEAAKYLLSKYDLSFLQITSFYINTLHHHLWDADETLEGWKIVDRHLGDFLEEEYNIVMMSDHGSNEIDVEFNINAWLENNGYLELADVTVSSTALKMGVTRNRLKRVARKLHINNIAKRILPKGILDPIPKESGELRGGTMSEKIDWGQTTAIASGQGPVYLTLSRDDPAYESIRREVCEEILDITAENGKPIAKDVIHGDELYHGKYVGEAPDLVIDQASGVHIAGGIVRSEEFRDPEEAPWVAENKNEGLLVAYGPDFGEGTAQTLSILDLAPTLLHLHDNSVPLDMDGEVRTDLFDPASSCIDRDISYESPRETEDEETKIRRIANQKAL